MRCKAGKISLAESWKKWLIYIEATYTPLIKKASTQASLLWKELRIHMIKDRWPLKNMSQFFSATWPRQSEMATPLLPPPHDRSTPKRGTYVRCPWPKPEEGSAPPLSLSELPSRSLWRNTDTPCWRTGEDRPGCERSSQVPLKWVLWPSSTHLPNNTTQGPPGLDDPSNRQPINISGK